MRKEKGSFLTHDRSRKTITVSVVGEADRENQFVQLNALFKKLALLVNLTPHDNGKVQGENS